MNTPPKKLKVDEIQEKFIKSWENSKVYSWNEEKTREESFVVDTPPPTVSGSLHMGHVCSYTQTDIIVRQQRMMGKNIFYPIGWDDNGLPTERRVQKLYLVSCDSTLAYDPNLKLEKRKKGEVLKISRKNFVEICQKQTLEDEKNYEHLWKTIGLSFDWDQQYSTISSHSQKISQASFVDLFEKGKVFQSKTPNLWDTSFQTAVAQAEVEDRPKNGVYHDIEFKVEGSANIVISTTRPELLAACIAVVAHPDDKRFQGLFGKDAVTPLFNVKVPIMPAEHADPEKGTGILMVCTFGDIHDVDWWKKTKNLPVRQILGREGTLLEVEFGTNDFPSQNVKEANENYQKIQGLYANQARKKIKELLDEEGSLKGTKPTEQMVKYYEKGDHPLEYIPTRQWYISLLEHKEQFLKMGSQIDWHPVSMKKRFDQWVEGLNQDWCISRQRYFGVPFPVWYRIGSEGEPDYENPIVASQNSLPIDPQIDCPPGFEEFQRGAVGGFIGDPDVMDTWATSSVSPLISSHFSFNEDRHKKLFPADLRPQGHEIIRTWAFYTVVKSWMHFGTIPWKNIALSGWVMDPQGKKMSKSKGNVTTPTSLLEKNYSVDAIRYWAGRSKLGVDTSIDENTLKIGHRLMMKIFNVAKFVQMQNKENFLKMPLSLVKEKIDQSFISKVAQLVKKSEIYLQNFQYAECLLETEDLFWQFCDHFVEIVKGRAYQEEGNERGISAKSALDNSMRAFVLLLAPVLPYVTDEVWSWGNEGTIHSNNIKNLFDEFKKLPEYKENVFQSAVMALGAIRKEKTALQKNMKWPVSQFKVTGPTERKEIWEAVKSDILRAGSVDESGWVVELSSGNKEEVFDITLGTSNV